MRPGNREHVSHVAMHTPCTPLHLGRSYRVQRYSSNMHRAMEEDSLMIRHDDDHQSLHIITHCYHHSMCAITQCTSSLTVHRYSLYTITHCTSSLNINHHSLYIITICTSSLTVHHDSLSTITHCTSSLTLHKHSLYIITQCTPSLTLLFYMSIVTYPNISAYWSKSSLYCGLWCKHIMSQSQYKQRNC